MKMSDIALPAGIHSQIGRNSQQLAESLADAVADMIEARLKVAPRASLAVSGGSTPVPFFRALATKALDWKRVDVVLVDERWVDEESPDSNTRLVRENLLQAGASDARYFALKQPGNSPSEVLGAVERALEQLTLPLDVLILGMGNDGHTASLFPDAPELPQALAIDNPSRVVAMTPVSQPQERITLTLCVLSAARETVLYLRGEDKLETLAAALSEPDQVAAMPVRAFLKPGLKLFWSP